MTTTKNLLTSLVKFSAIILLLNGGQSFGQTIIQTIDFSGDSNPVNETYTFETFDTSLGTLNSVDLTLTNIYVTGTASVTNNTAGSSSYTLRLVGDYTISDQVGEAGNNVEVVINTPTETSPGPVASGDTFTTGTLTNSSPGSNTTTLTFGTNDLSYYESTTAPELSLYLNNGNGVTVSGSAPYSADETSTGSGTVKVTYHYTAGAVPEPSEVMLMILGLGFVFWRYRLATRKV